MDPFIAAVREASGVEVMGPSMVRDSCAEGLVAKVVLPEMERAGSVRVVAPPVAERVGELPVRARPAPGAAVRVMLVSEVALKVSVLADQKGLPASMLAV